MPKSTKYIAIEDEFKKGEHDIFLLILEQLQKIEENTRK